MITPKIVKELARYSEIATTESTWEAYVLNEAINGTDNKVFLYDLATEEVEKIKKAGFKVDIGMELARAHCNTCKCSKNSKKRVYTEFIISW